MLTEIAWIRKEYNNLRQFYRQFWIDKSFFKELPCHCWMAIKNQLSIMKNLCMCACICVCTRLYVCECVYVYASQFMCILKLKQFDHFWIRFFLALAFYTNTVLRRLRLCKPETFILRVCCMWGGRHKSESQARLKVMSCSHKT